jgi:hypothetical protein
MFNKIIILIYINSIRIFYLLNIHIIFSGVQSLVNLRETSSDLGMVKAVIGQVVCELSYSVGLVAGCIVMHEGYGNTRSYNFRN